MSAVIETSKRKPFERFDAPELTAENPGFDKSIGGSSLAAILGVSPWESPYERWLRLTGRVAPAPSSPAMERGTKWEPIIGEMYQAAHPEYNVTHENPITGKTWFVRHAEHDYLTGQPDRMLHDQNGRLLSGLEIKTASWRTANKWGMEGTDQVPENYLLQSNWYAGLMGVDSWNLVVQFFNEPNAAGNETPCFCREYRIAFDGELFDLCVNRAVEFWTRYVVADVAPEISGQVGETFVRYVKEAFPRNVEPLAEATVEEEAVMEAVIEAKRKADEAAKLFDIEKARAQALIGDREGLYSKRLGKITWKNTRDRETTDWRGIVSELAPGKELLDKYTTTKPGNRTFLISTK